MKRVNLKDYKKEIIISSITSISGIIFAMILQFSFNLKGELYNMYMLFMLFSFVYSLSFQLTNIYFSKKSSDLFMKFLSSVIVDNIAINFVFTIFFIYSILKYRFILSIAMFFLTISLLIFVYTVINQFLWNLFYKKRDSLKFKFIFIISGLFFGFTLGGLINIFFLISHKILKKEL